ncbi:MAG: 2-phosphosulfolactate phosphatase [Candidatus Zixiibacteriota bacterium]|nr:MAG: 2-phosphosulfolactate phosphatase [candidate division Zixibacteria bacterium]
MHADLFMVPGPVKEKGLAGKTLVMIDVLRASTTICYALNAGAKSIIPVSEPGEATEMRAKIGVENSLICGERDGIKIENFDLGNSPLEYTRETVADKNIVLTTSNGTRTYGKAKNSGIIITGAIVNISAVAFRVAQEQNDLAIICAGHMEHVSIEDTICGGMLIHKVLTDEKLTLELNDAASLALLLYRSNSRALKETIAQGEHGRYLGKIGFGEDVALAADADSIPVLPILKDSQIKLEEVEL